LLENLQQPALIFSYHETINGNAALHIKLYAILVYDNIKASDFRIFGSNLKCGEQFQITELKNTIVNNRFVRLILTDFLSKALELEFFCSIFLFFVGPCVDKSKGTLKLLVILKIDKFLFVIHVTYL
jgi:hypothetical protein